MFSNNINIPEIPDTRTCITIGRKAPDFVALTTQGYIRLYDYMGKWVVLSSTPMAFTPVSTSEMISSAMLYPELEKRNATLIGLTTDNLFANLAWVNDVYEKTGILYPYPIISDNDKIISDLYGMMSPDRQHEVTVRDSIIINPSGYIRSILTLPITCGRSGEELLRILDSLQITDEYNLFTPAGWQQGEPVIVPSPTNVDEMMKVNQQTDPNVQCPFWYLCYENLPTEANSNDNTNTLNCY